MYAILKFSLKGDNRDPFHYWQSYITAPFVSIPYAANTILFFTARAIHVPVLPSHSSIFLTGMSCNYFPRLSPLTNYFKKKPKTDHFFLKNTDCFFLRHLLGSFTHQDNCFNKILSLFLYVSLSSTCLLYLPTFLTLPQIQTPGGLDFFLIICTEHQAQYYFSGEKKPKKSVTQAKHSKSYTQKQLG